MHQPDLFEKKRPAEATANELQIRVLVSALTGRGWLTAKQLQPLTGLSDRQLRAAANASAGQILGGQKGYRLTAQASQEEVSHTTRWLSHQAREMETRARNIRRIWNHQVAQEFVKA